MLTLLARLGLRAGEVAALRLEDIDWRAGEITVRGKGRRSERLPLPADVGEPVAAYLRDGRPGRSTANGRCSCGSGPRMRGLTSGGVTQAVVACRAAGRAGPVHAHRLRHSAATGMLRAGAGLPEIGQVLRHRRLMSTAIYAKTDHRALRGAGAALAGRRGMSPLRQALRRLPRGPPRPGLQARHAEKLLGQFVSYLERPAARHGHHRARAGVGESAGRDPCWHAQRLSMARGFAAHLHAADPAAEIPPAGLIPARTPRAVPYLYSAAEVTALMAATSSLRSPLRAATYQTLIGLLAATGMRVGEAIRLDRPDFDPAAGVLTVRDAKFGKSRLVPLHPTTTAALAGYLRLRDQLLPGPAHPAVFISPAGTRLAYCNVHATWRLLVRRAGAAPRSPAAGPARTTCATPSRSPACSTPTPPGGTGRPGSPCWPPTSDTSTRPPPTGTCPPPPNCSPWPGSASTMHRSRAVTALAPDPAGVLHRPADPPAARQPADHRRLPRHLAAAARLRLRPHRQAASRLDIADLDAPLIGAFLDHLEHDRGNSPRTRNARLAAIHSMFGYAALRHPEHAESIARVLAIPPKRFDRALVTWLTETEADALLAAPDKSHLGRAARPRHDRARRPDRPADLRADRPDPRRRPPRHRAARLLPRQRTQAADHPAHQDHRRRPARLARRTPRRPGQPLFPNRTGGTAQPRRGRETPRPARPPPRPGNAPR